MAQEHRPHCGGLHRKALLGKRLGDPFADQELVLDEQTPGSARPDYASFPSAPVRNRAPVMAKRAVNKCVQGDENLSEILVCEWLRPGRAADFCRAVGGARPSFGPPLEESARSRLNGIHGQPRVRARRHHARGTAEGLCLRHLPDGGKRRGSGALLDRARAARHYSARTLPCAGPAGADGALRLFHRRGRPRFRRRHCRLRRTRSRARAHLDQRPHP